MTPRFVFHPAARADLAEALLWYDHQRTGLGAELGAVVAETIRRISAHPEAFPRVEGSIRRAVLRRFPYSILYVVRPEEIEVLGVFHHRRDPSIWRGRSPV
jgi:plasmid stabilization system protein ParE